MAQPTSTTVPISFVVKLLEPVPDREKQEALVERSGIAPTLLDESSARVTTDQFSTLYRLLARELDDELPGMFSRPIRGGALKLLCLSMLESANLRIALYRLSRFFRLILDDLAIEVGVTADEVCVSLVPRSGGPEISVFAQEIVLKVIHGVMSWLAGKKMSLTRVDLCYSPPEHVAAYGFLYPGPSHFNQARTALHFDLLNLEVPIRQSKRALSDFLGRAPADWLFVSSAERVISHRVREYLEKHLEQPTTIADAAKALHFSVRTLSRRLDIEGTTFQAIKDELRRDVAIQLLTKTDTPVSVIGTEIGFDDPTTFYRAFKKWTGSTPGAYRPKR